jgi:hypothetical protein
VPFESNRRYKEETLRDQGVTKAMPFFRFPL